MAVSALIPTYNRLSQLPRAIDSILSQTFPVGEIVVVDDGSTDGTADAILRRYGAAVRLIRQKHGGVGRARQRALEEARCEWVAFLDSDDVWLPRKLELEFQALECMGHEFGVCFTDCAYAGNPGLQLSPFEEAGLKPCAPFGPLEDSVKHILGRFTPIYIQSLLARRALLLEAGGFDEFLTVAEDTDLFFRLALKTGFCFVSEPLVEVDRAPGRPSPLMEAFARMDDQTYACKQHMFRKWLSLPELQDRAIRAAIEEHLRLLNYGWAAARLSRLQFRRALSNVQDLRTIGVSEGAIFGTLASRAARKLDRKIRRP
jgi:glycosyltransferase involved in cell wall biosynthesis